MKIRQILNNNVALVTRGRNGQILLTFFERLGTGDSAFFTLFPTKKWKNQQCKFPLSD